jgi:4-amino-4-deoxy-L-arabinose transferase-like glycosyltransferase
MFSTLPGKVCLVGVLAGLALGLRAIALAVFDDSLLRSPEGDPDAYRRIARSVAARGEYALAPGRLTALRPPGYVLAVLGSSSRSDPDYGLIGLHMAASLAAVGATYALARRFAGPPAAYAAAALVAVDPTLIRQSAVAMSETTFTALFAAALAAFLWGDGKPVGRSVAAGVFLGLGALTRPIAVACWLAVGVAGAAARRTGPWLVATLVAALVYLPWPIRNYLALDEAVATTTHGGYTLWLGMNPEYYREVVAGPHAVWPEASFADWTRENAAATAGMNEFEADAYYRKQAVDWMLSHPTEAARSALHHVGSLWTPLPHLGPLWQRWGVAAYYALLYTAAAAGTVRGRAWRWPGSALLACLAGATLVHAAYWSNVRMRAPLTPALAVLAALAFAPTARRLTKRFERVESGGRD